MPRKKSNTQPAPESEIVYDEETGNHILYTQMTYPNGSPINLHIVDTFYGPVLTDGGETARQMGRHRIEDEMTLDVAQLLLWTKVHYAYRLRAARNIKLCDMGSDRLETDADDFIDALRRVMGAIVEIITVESGRDRQAQSDKHPG